ncbi:MAG: DnaJ domain-containing protein [Planctomycetota bacterium]|nr:DnaJ domain-containing protein [Planctomycetota bacterium]
MDYYKVLGVARSASADEIRKAYKKLAREFHPDVKPDDKVAAERFREIQQAYDVLRDTDKRTKYDQFGPDFQKMRGGGGWSTGAGGAQIDLGDLFGNMFGGGAPGGGQRRQRAQKGQDAKTEIQVPFSVAAEGGTYELSLDKGGKTERLDVKIPAGVSHGGAIRLSGQGHAGSGGGPAGDLLVTIKVAPHPYFRREGVNLVVDVPVTPSEAVLGAKIDVPTLTQGQVVLTMPPNTSSGRRLRLPKMGIHDQRAGKQGDQFVVIKIVVPEEPAPEALKLYEQLQDLDDTSPRDGLW